MGSAAGARKTAATRIGVSVEEYDRRVAAGEKWCKACSAWQDRAAFGLDRSRSDGLASTCTLSRTAVNPAPGRRERREQGARGLGWCRGCSTWTPGVLSGACRGHRNAEARNRYARDSETIRQRVYARKRQLDPIPGWWVTAHRKRFGGLCSYGCGRVATSNDHIWPVASGGKSRPGNLVPACTSCNSVKRDSDPAPWVLRGVEAFPRQWRDLAALAFEHGGHNWTDVLEEMAA